MAMRERGSETIDPYEPPEQPAYEWEYDEEPAYRRGPRILWGRLAVLGAFLLVALLIGRATAGGGVPQDDLDEARAQRNDARAQVAEQQEEITTLRQQVAGLQEEIDLLRAADPTAGDENDPGTGTETTGKTYVVKSGDTLRDIAERFYGDATMDDYIAEANDISDASQIQAGQELTIPPDPNAQ